MDKTTKQRLVRQGFVGITDTTLREVGPWLRLAPALCAAIILTGTALENWVMFWMLTPVGIIAAATGKHPFDLIYDVVIRRLLKRRRSLPAYRAPRRFSAALASAGNLSAGLAFLKGYVLTGVVIGSFFGGAVLLGATTDICLGCLIYYGVMPASGPRSPQASNAVVTMLQRQSISAPQAALYQRPQLRRTGSH